MAETDVLPAQTDSQPVAQEKHFLLSKVIWFNFALAILGVIEVIQRSNLLNGNMLVIVAIIGIFLRFVTNQPLYALPKQNLDKSNAK